ncbi:caspase-7-like [Condylostylus longicornis]|uniref:caspase-7-like n=1 Tax=Condylostylus longicornis TaxID=2530218 RepID=UPI00244E277E|nr:caspase-7-like [Condylostylus longicornis]
MAEQKAGKLIIFNMENFENNRFSNLPGSQDVETLQSTFRKFNCDVKDVHKDLTKDELKKEIEKISKSNFQDYKYLAIAILTHGHRQGMMVVNDCKLINLDTHVILPILRNRSLANKPKLFIVDACKGGFDLLSAHTDAKPFFDEPIIGNTLRCYATTEGFKACATEDGGSVFTAEFCKFLENEGKEKSVEDIMKLTIKTLQKKYFQVPSYETNMTDPFILGDYI